jgi:hypothetical protein
MIKSNSFTNIILDDLEHIIFDHPAYGGGSVYVSDSVKNIKTFFHLKELLSHTFTKKYNLIYQNDSLTHGCDFTETKKENTDIINKILVDNKDKVFMIIDIDRFDCFSLRQNDNCQVWPRKYFAPFYSWTNRGSRDESVIQRERQYWFCSILGRSDYFRSHMFNWFLNEGLDKKNKLSYLANGIDSRNIKLNNDQQENFISTNGDTQYKNLIPFNNFESMEEIPVDNNGRIDKAMPLYDCLFNILVETYAMNDSAFHTEKSLNTILYGHIPIILGGPGSMKKLQDMGMIIPDYIQWSMWDDIPMDELNFSKQDIVKRQLTDLFTKHSINDIDTDWYPYALRNFKKFNNLESECAKEEREICRWILITTHNVSNPKYQYLYK